MTGINTGWAVNEPRIFVSLTELIDDPPTPGLVIIADTRHTRGSEAEVVAAAHVVEKILDRTVPRWRLASLPDIRHPWSRHHEAALQAIVELQRANEVRAMLGDDAPTLDVATLHPWVWDGARSMWNSGYPRQAVFDAGKKVNAEAQRKYGTRDLSEADLFTQAFSDAAPTPERPRLRLPDDDDGKTARSRRRGMREFASGCYAAIRNPQGHDEQAELPEHEAIEQLATLSILARWVDRAELELSNAAISCHVSPTWMGNRTRTQARDTLVRLSYEANQRGRSIGRSCLLPGWP